MLLLRLVASSHFIIDEGLEGLSGDAERQPWEVDCAVGVAIVVAPLLGFMDSKARGGNGSWWLWCFSNGVCQIVILRHVLVAAGWVSVVLWCGAGEIPSKSLVLWRQHRK